jgi:hypothetical protein
LRTLTRYSWLFVVLCWTLQSGIVWAQPGSAPTDAPVIEADRVRITEHLRHVEQTLRRRDVSHLSAAQARERLRNLDRLHAYWTHGVFPHNTHHRERTPYFIDDDGRTCAMAQLIIDSGHADLAEALARTQNYARIRDMHSPALAAWLAASGLSLEEAAWIQPGYGPPCCCSQSLEPVCAKSKYFEATHSLRNECEAVVCWQEKVVNEGLCEKDQGASDGGVSFDRYVWGYSPAPECQSRTRAPSGCQLVPRSTAPSPWLWFLPLLVLLVQARSMVRSARIRRRINSR